MFRILKVLNHNSILALKEDNVTEVIILGKGVGFGKKVSERFEPEVDVKIYELKKETERGNSFTLVQKLDPMYLEITSEIIQSAEILLGELDENILLPLADHIAFAVARIKDNGVLMNPMAQDIKVLFDKEYMAAKKGVEIILGKTGVRMEEDETSYIALHLHSARDKENMSEVLKQTQLVHESMSMIEAYIEKPLDPDSLAYNRLMSHMKYMLMRMKKGEGIELDMNDYIKNQHPKSYDFSRMLCKKIGDDTGLPYTDQEIGYLAVHIERVRM